MERLDRAVEIGDALVRAARRRYRRGADRRLGCAAARARLANFDGPARSRDQGPRARRAVAVRGRPASPRRRSCERAVAVVADIAVQWGYAGRLARSLSPRHGALELYTPPEGVSEAASVEYRISIARLLLQKATAEFDRDDAKAAIATAGRAVALYERDILPHTRHEWALERLRPAARPARPTRRMPPATRTLRARPIARSRQSSPRWCRSSPTSRGCGSPSLEQRVPVRAGALLPGRARREPRRLMDDLAKRIDDAVPIGATLMSEWRSIRARIADLRAGDARVVGRRSIQRASAPAHGHSLLPGCGVDPGTESRDLAGLASVQGSWPTCSNETRRQGGRAHRSRGRHRHLAHAPSSSTASTTSSRSSSPRP